MFQVYTRCVSGEVAGSTSAALLPNVPCRLVVIKALSDNAGNVYIGGVADNGTANVTVPGGTTDTTSGMPLAASESVTLYVDNLNKMSYICDNAGDDFAYIVHR